MGPISLLMSHLIPYFETHVWLYVFNKFWVLIGRGYESKSCQDEPEARFKAGTIELDNSESQYGCQLKSSSSLAGHAPSQRLASPVSSSELHWAASAQLQAELTSHISADQTKCISIHLKACIMYERNDRCLSTLSGNRTAVSGGLHRRSVRFNAQLVRAHLYQLAPVEPGQWAVAVSLQCNEMRRPRAARARSVARRPRSAQSIDRTRAPH